MTPLFESLAKQRVRKRQQWLRWRLFNDVGVVLVPQVLMKLADRAVIMENLADDFAVGNHHPGLIELHQSLKGARSSPPVRAREKLNVLAHPIRLREN